MTVESKYNRTYKKSDKTQELTAERAKKELVVFKFEWKTRGDYSRVNPRIPWQHYRYTRLEQQLQNVGLG